MVKGSFIMTLTQAALVFCINLIYIAGRAFQQLNVVHDKVLLVPVVSMMMAMCEVFLWGGAALAVVKGSRADMALYAVTLGISGSIGAILSMSLHKRVRND
jgi:hypothetical protein